MENSSVTVDTTHVVLGAKLSDFGQVAMVGNHHTCLPLDGLHHESSHMWVLKSFLEKQNNKKIKNGGRKIAVRLVYDQELR